MIYGNNYNISIKYWQFFDKNTNGAEIHNSILM